MLSPTAEAEVRQRTMAFLAEMDAQPLPVWAADVEADTLTFGVTIVKDFGRDALTLVVDLVNAESRRLGLS